MTNCLWQFMWSTRPPNGVHQAFALFGDVMGEGKSGPVETGLTGLVATACVGALLRKP